MQITEGAYHMASQVLKLPNGQNHANEAYNKSMIRCTLNVFYSANVIASAFLLPNEHMCSVHHPSILSIIKNNFYDIILEMF